MTRTSGMWAPPGGGSGHRPENGTPPRASPPGWLPRSAAPPSRRRRLGNRWPAQDAAHHLLSHLLRDHGRRQPALRRVPIGDAEHGAQHGEGHERGVVLQEGAGGNAVLHDRADQALVAALEGADEGVALLAEAMAGVEDVGEAVEVVENVADQVAD